MAATPSKVLNPHPKLIRVVVSVRVDAGQAEDGRIIEYYTYGSEDREAQILLQINGSCGSGQGPTQGEGFHERPCEYSDKC